VAEGYAPVVAVLVAAAKADDRIVVPKERRRLRTSADRAKLGSSSPAGGPTSRKDT
jgi:hypothetical protein